MSAECKRCGEPLEKDSACGDGIDHTPDDTALLEACREWIETRTRTEHDSLTADPMEECNHSDCRDARALLARLNERLEVK